MAPLLNSKRFCEILLEACLVSGVGSFVIFLTFESVQIKSRFGVSNRYRGARLRLSSSAFK
jgi:hypothetical protein